MILFQSCREEKQSYPREHLILSPKELGAAAEPSMAAARTPSSNKSRSGIVFPILKSFPSGMHFRAHGLVPHPSRAQAYMNGSLRLALPD